MSEDVAREALLQFVEKKWTYSSKPAKHLVFKDLRPLTVYRVDATSTHCSLCSFPMIMFAMLPVDDSSIYCNYVIH